MILMAPLLLGALTLALSGLYQNHPACQPACQPAMDVQDFT